MEVVEIKMRCLYVGGGGYDEQFFGMLDAILKNACLDAFRARLPTFVQFGMISRSESVLGDCAEFSIYLFNDAATY
jgi:hypothetical protein